MEIFWRKSPLSPLRVTTYESSRLEVFCKKGALKKFAKFTEKSTYARASFLFKFLVSAFNFVKKETLVQVFP